MIRFSELIDNIEFDGDILVRVWDEESETYTREFTRYDDLTEAELEPLWNLEVTHIYPYSIFPYIATVIELRA